MAEMPGIEVPVILAREDIAALNRLAESMDRLANAMAELAEKFGQASGTVNEFHTHYHSPAGYNPNSYNPWQVQYGGGLQV